MNTKTYSLFLFFLVSMQFSCDKSDVYVEPAGLLDGYSFESEPIQFSSFAQFGDNYTLTWTKGDAFDGEGCLRITSGQQNNQSFSFWNLPYADFEPNQPFKIKVRVKTVDMEGSGGVQVNLFARSKDRSSSISSGIGEQISDTNGKWQTIEVSLTNNPTDAVGVIDVYFLFLAGSSGTAYWDKLEVFTGE